MGQSNLEKIQSCIVDLTESGQISRQQAQFFLKDYIVSGESIKDINYFLQNQSVDLFIKYFINATYVYENPLSSQNGSPCRTVEEKNQLRLGNKVMETGCTELNERIKYLLNDVKAIYMSDRPQILSVREKIKDYIIFYLEIQSYRYYYYNKGTMKETNSKILYIYDTPHDSQIYKYAASYSDSSRNSKLQEIVKEKYVSYQNLCLQFYEEESLHIVIIQINMEKWKYSKIADEKTMKNIMRGIFTPLANKMIEIYDTRQEVRQMHYKNFFTEFTLTLIEHFTYLESKRIQYLVTQIQSTIDKSESRGIQRIESNKQSILKKIRSWKQTYSTSQKLLILSFSKKKTLEFVFQTDESALELKNYQGEISQMESCLSFFLDGNKKKIKKVLKSYEKLSNEKIVLSDNIVISISHDSSSIDHKTLTLIYLLERGNQKSKMMKKKKQSQPLVEKENTLIKRVNFQKSENARVEQIGWFRDFLKEEGQAMASSNKTQRKNIMKLPKLGKQYRMCNYKGLYLEEELKQRMDVDDQNVNLLAYSPDRLEIFVLKVFSRLTFFKQLPHQNDEFPKFLREIHANYEKNNNKFHNFIHGVNVMHTCYLLCKCRKNQQILTQFDIFIIVLSGLCHDVGHTGFTNLFQIAKQSDIALTYNNNSPLQMYHASQTFQILRKSSNNFLSSLPQKQFAYFRHLVISSILYTDIKEHFNLMKKFESRKDMFEVEDTTVLAGMIIHASDFGGSVKNFEICKKWSLLVNQEFTNQYKEQGVLGLPQTPFMKDLDKMHVLAKNEIGFLKVIVHPLYRELNVFYDDETLKKMVKNVENNMKLWESYLQTQSQMSQKKQSLKKEKV